MTNSQNKLIALLRQNGGEMESHKIPTFRYRSVVVLVREGFVKRVTCGICSGCEFGKRYNEDWHCERERLKYLG